MTLKEVTNSIISVATKLPNINTAYEGDIYDLNENPDVEFTSVVLTQRQHYYNEENECWNYNFVMFYVDKLTTDESNRIDIQSNGIICLHNIIRSLRNIFEVDTQDEEYDTFTQRFTSMCAGAFVSFSVIVPDYDCGYEVEITVEEEEEEDDETTI